MGDETDFLVIGSGPGGATVARELARHGRRVVLLERGRDWRGHPLYGTYPGALIYADRRAMLFTREGLNVIRPIMLGGATSMYCGCSAPPAPWWRERYGIDLETFASDTAHELGIAPLPPELRGEASTRIAEAGTALGMPWLPQDKFVFPQRARFDCGARCMLGCRCGAKWNAAEYIDDAVAAGCTVYTGTRVHLVIIEDGTATGVSGTRGGRPFTMRARTIIVAAGGIGSARLLRASGLDAAGRGIAMDTTVMVYGHSPGRPGMGADPPMTWSAADDELGVLYSTLIDPWLMYPLIMAAKGPAWPLTWHRWGSTLGVMIKLKDEISGEVDARSISKGLTTADRERLARAESVAHEILKRAGCRPDTIFTTPLRGTHPSATVRIGSMLTSDLETEVRGLCVCDASVFPEALARPTVLTIIALARRLARRLLDDRQDPPSRPGRP
ncbi:MAG: GMC family oxidoreductase N-terminal domain-containing protein [Gemmatimonadetes bacterium]|nr:GMC family oxidoreductase N-terminal domain-containing protein [Gemmatimonadota bacterium]